jgi:hypothetical protein
VGLIELPTEIVWIAKEGGSIRHIARGSRIFNDLDDTLCGRSLWPTIPKDNYLVGLFDKCQHCTRVYRRELNRLTDNARNEGIV